MKPIPLHYAVSRVKSLSVTILFFSLAIRTVNGQSKPTELKQANGSRMQYFISLPKIWSSGKQYPVVIILEAAEKEYKNNLERFINARGDLPFILVAPIHTGNGNQGRRDPKLFPYSVETWDYIDKVGDCTFNDEGILQIIKDIKSQYNVEDKLYVTGFEAGTHLLWALIFSHPEYFYAAIPVGGNYRGRCVDVNTISVNPAKTNIEIVGFFGGKDEYFGPKGSNYNQWTEPKSIALKNGYKNISEKVFPDKAHEPLPSEVLNYFNQLYQKRKN